VLSLAAMALEAVAVVLEALLVRLWGMELLAQRVSALVALA
jgi:hypothetical protein